MIWIMPIGVGECEFGSRNSVMSARASHPRLVGVNHAALCLVTRDQEKGSQAGFISGGRVETDS